MPTDTISANVISSEVQTILERVVEWLYSITPTIAGALAVLVIGWIIIGWFKRYVHFFFKRHDFDPAVETFLESFIGIALKIVLVVVVVSMLGVKTSSLIAVLGAMSLAVGLALQGSLSNFAGGVLILVFKPFRVGDFIEAQGQSGTVKKIEIFNTILFTADNKKVVLPNGNLANDVMVNYTYAKKRREDIIIGISYDSDVQKAQELILKLLQENDKVITNPEPTMGVSNLGEYSVDIQVRFWVRTDDYLSMKYWFLENIKDRFSKSGISIPYPHREIHVCNTRSTKSKSK
ncbi:MAG: mechanosensitive ion channel family protein [Patescibacteria group bacterium]